MRVKVPYRSSSKSVYERFCATYPDISISFKEWKKVIYTYNLLYRDYILETGSRIKMPHGFGPFSITKQKLKLFKNYKDKDGKQYINLPVDWAKTKKAGKRIYHRNSHTDGYKCSWMWMHKDARFHLSEVWNFKPSRTTSRALKTYLSMPDSPYLQKYKNWKRK